MRTYGQFCGIAKALDVIGDRWTLLIVRELLALGPCRHTDLRNGLPGIASNLLVERLRDLEQAGLIHREPTPPPVATTLFALTDRGRELESVLRELSRWGMPLLGEHAAGESFRTHWLALPVRELTDRTPDRPPVALQLHADGNEDLVVEVKDGAVHTHPGRVDDATASLTGPPQLLTALLSGDVDLTGAQQRGLRLDGDPQAVLRVLPADTSAGPAAR
ncbi:winged helix-turn-helix transcriptional regulator [Micromonospora sp. WMMA1363]|uniref:winged helix-turn-helix transcriptional regulator n=1 Tax=Micromonospora sp. WMMA1363 TaxID=3053985 RepID=UPI00259CDF51|nr:winged helix-turn-helix transcriptional regulator [Micromonospora sp. WMMA1363]MDM4719536.1 winged helix-turn-helix transcriptional regulator [Micromonospora sp. WMMA1363]